MKKIQFLFVVLLFACQPKENVSQKNEVYFVENQEITAQVIRIIDGDTVEVLYQNKPLKVRLAHIDCPEKRGKQPFGNAAKKAVSDLCFGQKVQLISDKKTDRYGRVIAEIINENGLNVNQEMLRLGMAWHFKKYSKSQVYADLEKQARKNKIGLWKESHPTPPWEWRKK